MNRRSLALVLAAVSLFARDGLALSAGALPAPSPPQVLEDARDACSGAQAGARCRVRIEERFESGMCVAFTGVSLVCAVDAPP